MLSCKQNESRRARSGIAPGATAVNRNEPHQTWNIPSEKRKKPAETLALEAEGTGLEHPSNPQGNQQVSGDPTHNPTHPGALPNNQTLLDPRLQAIIDRWESLSESTKTKMVRLID
jgi:hypothetical protein